MTTDLIVLALSDRCTFCHAPAAVPCRTVPYDEHLAYGTGKVHDEPHAVRMFAAREPDLITRSGREHIPVEERVGFLRADLMIPPFGGITEQTRAVNQSIHDLKLTIGAIRGVIALYEQARARGTSNDQLQKGASLLMSEIECWILAWRRGAHPEYKRVRAAQRASKATP